MTNSINCPYCLAAFPSLEALQRHWEEPNHCNKQIATATAHVIAYLISEKEEGRTPSEIAEKILQMNTAAYAAMLGGGERWVSDSANEKVAITHTINAAQYAQAGYENGYYYFTPSLDTPMLSLQPLFDMGYRLVFATGRFGEPILLKKRFE